MNLRRAALASLRPIKPIRTSMIANPAIIFSLVWLSVLFLLSLSMTSQIVPMTSFGLLMVFGNITFAVGLALLIAGHKPSKRRQPNEIDLAILSVFVVRIRNIWIIGSAIEIYVSGGLPFFWALTESGSLKDYTDFGIPSFHGLMNALYIQVMCGYFILWQLAGNKRSRNLFFILLFWPILMLGRGIILSVVVQSLAVYLVINRLNFKTMFKLFILGLFNIILFGLIGNLRGTTNPFRYLVEERWLWLFDQLPSGFLWVYIYVTSGVNNIFYNINTIEPIGEFDKTFFKLIPSFVRGLLGIEERADVLEFADRNLNVSTFYAGSFSDFGVAGGFFYGCTVILVALLVYRQARKYALWAILAYSVMFQVLVFSIFYDMFLLLPTLAQLLIALAFMRFHAVKRRRMSRRFGN